MPDYSKSKIYKLQCEDGHFYIGSTATELRYRFAKHKQTHSKAQPNTRAYKHINELGWDKVRVILVEEVVCENKQQLLQIEDKHIQSEHQNILCLNTFRAFTTDEEKKLQEKEWRDSHTSELIEYRKTRYDINKQEDNARSKKYRDTHKEEVSSYLKSYYEKNREKLLAYQKAYKLKKKTEKADME